MKQQLRNLSFALFASLAVLACKSTDDKGASTGKNVGKTADQLEATTKNLDSTVAALHDLTENPAPDLTTQRSAYTKSLSALKSSCEDLAKSVTAMDASGREFFAKWDAQLASMQNEDIRESSEERRKDLEERFNKLKGEFAKLKADLDPLAADLNDISTALNADLTMNGLESLKPAVKKVDKAAGSVKEDLTDLAKRFRDMDNELARSGPAAVPEGT